MGLFNNPDWEKLRKLLKNANGILKLDLATLKTKPAEIRTNKFNEIEKDAIDYEENHSDTVERNIDIDMRAKFLFAQLKIATTFYVNKESSPITERFTQKEMEIYRDLEEFNVFDILTINEIRERMHRHEGGILAMLEKFANKQYDRIDVVLDDPTIKLPIRYYIKKEYGKRIEKIKEATMEYIRIIGLKPLTEKEKKLLPNATASKPQVPEEKVSVEAQIPQETKIKKPNMEEEKPETKVEPPKIEARKLPEVKGKEYCRYVTRDSAKALELKFIERFNLKMNALPKKLWNPIENEEYTINSWKDSYYEMDNKNAIFEELKEILPYEIETKMPHNKRAIYVVWKRKYGFFGEKEKKIVIEAAVLNHWREYGEKGYDTKPATLTELMAILSKYLEAAKAGKYYHSIGIASPTGWEDKIRDYIQSEDFHRNFVSRNISVALVDTETGEMIYNPNDTNIKQFIYLFEQMFDNEKVEKCKTLLRNKLRFKNYVVLEDILKETKEDISIVKKAFYDLEEEGTGKVRYIEDVGLCYEFKN